MRMSLLALLLPVLVLASSPTDTLSCDETEYRPFVECLERNIQRPGVVCSSAYDGTDFMAKCIDRPFPATDIVCEDPPSTPVPFTFWGCVLSYLEDGNRVDVHRKYSGGLWKLYAHR